MVEIQTAIDIKNLEAIAARFRDGVEIKDRRYRFVRYRNCFVGSEAVDFMIHHRLASTRDAAVVLGRSIMKEIGSFEHVTRDHPFQGRNNMM
jgi:potassium efflux system protein